MTLFQISVSPRRRAAARFNGEVRREVQRALLEAKARQGITQAKIAREIDVDRSVINREVRGVRDISLGRLAEIGSLIGKRAIFRYEEEATTGNHAFVDLASDYATVVCDTDSVSEVVA